jgi:uncharacterized membrane protein YccC
MVRLERSRELLAVDLTKLDLRKGALGTVAVIIAATVVERFGLVGETAGLAALFVLATDHPGSTRDRLSGVVTLTMTGSVIAFLAILVGTDHAVAAGLLTFAVTAITTLVSGRGTTVAGRALVLSIWAVFALGFNGDTRTALELALAFVLGGAIATAALWIGSRGESHTAAEESVESEVRSVDDLIRSPLAAIALIRASAVAVGTVLGIFWYPDHPVWPALTVLLVMTSSPGQAIGAGLLRTFGTIIGVLAAEVVIEVFGDSEAALLVAFAIFAFGMFAFKNVAFWIYVFFLTGVLILIQALVGADADAAAIDRLTATILGAVIAFVGIAIGWLVVRSAERQPRAS